MKDELLITPGHCKEQIGYLTVSDPSDGDPVVLAATPRYDRKGRIFPPSSPPFQSGYYYPTKEQTTANLSLYAEAHNVYNETKISPRQMEQEITRLREQVVELKSAVDIAHRVMLYREWNCYDEPSLEREAFDAANRIRNPHHYVTQR